MKSSWHLTIAISVAALSIAAASGIRGGSMHAFRQENVLGTSFEMKVIAPASAAERAEGAALREIVREQAILSSWDKNSEFSRWFATRNETVKVSPELFEVLSLFDTWRERTGGALDASAEAVSRAWKSAEQQGRIPSQDELTHAVAIHQIDLAFLAHLHE